MNTPVNFGSASDLSDCQISVGGNNHYIPQQLAMASPGVEQLRWLHPVRPGDRLRLRVSILAVQRSRSKPDRGVVTARQEVINQHGQTVMSLDGKSMHRVQP
ncbi:MaoC family dehydratase N-terminal domain-containing protein [Acidovorax sp. D2M1]|uniref:MaoC family dehydratase N-terminal domain-containing protein n=2 Tax=Acidovorax benzenivorans TaxID=2987520 RepID=A0ABT5S0U6_9BURK|nr:MaoC family dehydratase N-terminal domain-containing protein [Acidovorax benzenivorans]